MHSPRRSASEAIRRAAEQFRQPAGQVAALDVAVVGRHRPAGDQAQRDDLLVHEAAGRGADRVLQVQQAQVILAALAHHDPPPPLGRVGDQAFQFAVDLALQMAGEGADPDRALVLLRPDAGRRQVAQRLAGAGAGLDQHQMRIAADFPRRERGGGGAGIIALARPLFGMRTQHGGQPQPRLGFGDRMGGRRRQGRGVLPLRQFFPDLQRLVRRGASGRPSAWVT